MFVLASSETWQLTFSNFLTHPLLAEFSNYYRTELCTRCREYFYNILLADPSCASINNFLNSYKLFIVFINLIKITWNEQSVRQENYFQNLYREILKCLTKKKWNFPYEKEIDYSVSSQVSRDYGSLNDKITFKIYIVKFQCD